MVDWTAEKITDLLAQKHREDLFVPQCRNGPSWSAARGQLRVMDAWAMNRSWAHTTFTGYEVKVARSDFLSDQKWQLYLPFCNFFSFVCPSRLIEGRELAEGVGLIWVSSKGKLVTKVRPTPRKVDAERVLPLLLYVLMSRVIVCGGAQEANLADDPTDHRTALHLRRLRQQVESAEERRQLAELVNEHVHARVADMESQVRKLSAVQREAETLKAGLDKLGIRWDPGQGSWAAERQIRSRLGEDAVEEIQRVVGVLDKLTYHLRALVPSSTGGLDQRRGGGVG